MEFKRAEAERKDNEDSVAEKVEYMTGERSKTFAAGALKANEIIQMNNKKKSEEIKAK